MYLALCLHQKILSTCELQADPIIRGYDSLVDYLFTSVDVAHGDVLFLYIYAISTAMYMRLYYGSREIKSLNAAECYTGWHKINWTSRNYIWATF